MMSINNRANPAEDEIPTDDQLSQIGMDYFGLFSGDSPETERDPGLLITNEDVRRIKRYVKTGLELPTDLEQVRQLLGGQNSEIKGLEAEAIQELYLGINDHAKSWSPIERDMKAVGSDLNVFASNLITTSGEIVGFIKGLESYQQRQVGDLTPDEIDKLPPVALLPGEEQKIPALLGLVNDLKGYIGEHSASTQRVKNGVGTFKDMLKGTIAPGVSLKVQLIASADTDETIKQLTAQVELLNTRINEKLAEYESYSDYKWYGFWWGPIGGGISWSIYGPKAKQALREKDQLVAEKRTLEQQIEQLNRLLSSMLSLQTSLQDLQVRIDGAASSVSNLESLWVLLEELVDSSYGKLDGITNAMYLVSFVSRFKTVISNWEDIKKQSWDLLTAFNNVLDEPVA